MKVGVRIENFVLASESACLSDSLKITTQLFGIEIIEKKCIPVLFDNCGIHCFSVFILSVLHVICEFDLNELTRLC